MSIKRSTWLLFPVLVLLGGLVFFYAQAPACTAVCYVDAASGDDANSGAAVDAAKRTITAALQTVEAGGEVVVAAGEYVEQVFINKNVTLRGGGAGATILRAPEALVDSLPLPRNTDSVHSIITLEGGAQASVSGVTVLGPLNAASCDDETSGIYVYQSSALRLTDAEVRDIYLNPTGAEALTGCQAGLAIRIGEYEGATPGTAQIERVVISGFQKTGLLIGGVGSQATITDSEIIGAGPNLNLAQNGVQVSAGALATIRNNTIRDLLCENGSCGSDPTDKFASSAIILFGAGSGVVAEDNRLLNNDIGIYNLSIGTIIQNNILDGNRYIGILLDEGSATVSNNQIVGGDYGVLLVSFNAELYGITNDSEGTLTRNVITGAEFGIGVIDENQTDFISPQLTANYNSIAGNETGFNNPTAVVMELTCNWWGAADGPSGASVGSGDEVSRSATFLPWLTSDTLDTTCVGGSNAPPNAGDDSAETIAGTPVTVALLPNDSDPDGDVLGITPGSPANGSLVLNDDGSITYTPDPGFEGNERFTYTISDGKGGIDEALILIVVQPPPNTPPDAVDDSATTAFETAVTVRPLLNDSDADGDPLTITTLAAPTHGTFTDNGGGLFTYTPNAGFSGKDTFRYTIDDGQGSTDTASISIDVLPPPNTPPSAQPDSAETTEGAPVLISPLANDSDPDGDALTLTTATDPANGSITINADGTISYTPNAGYVGADSFDYSISDGRGGAASASISVNVLPAPNRPPDAQDDSAQTTAGIAVTVGALSNDSDPDGDPLLITLVGSPSNGSANANSNGSITYTPNAGFVGSDSFVYTIIDDEDASDIATITIEVLPPPNTPPVAQADSASATQDSPVTIDVLANDSDPDGDALTVIGASQPLSGVATVNADGTITYIPNVGYTGVDTFNYTISDGEAGESSATVIVVVNALPNTPPTAADDAAQTQVDIAVTIDVLANDSDAEGEPLTIASLGAPTNGTLTIEGTVVLYTPSTGFVGDDSFTYTINDTSGGSDTARVTVTVLPRENRPPQTADDAVSTTLNQPVLITPLANDRDADGDPLTLLSVGSASNGIATTNPDGTILYAPNQGFLGQDQFTYRVSDGRDGESEATVRVTVLPPPNTPPTANADFASTDAATPVVINVILNDSDADLDSFSVQGVGEPANGAATSNGDGTVTYTPNSGFTGIDSFTYTLVDSRGSSSSGTVNVEVRAPAPETGNLILMNVVSWSNVEPNPDRLFKFCISGPSYPVLDNCRIVTETQGSSLLWRNLLPGTYTLKEGDPGTGWEWENSGVTAEVYASGTTFTSMSNALQYVHEPLTPVCPENFNPIIEVPLSTLESGGEQILQWIRITSPALVTVEIVSKVGHPERGCPFSDNRCNTESNEEFNVRVNQEVIEVIPDHGDNGWAAFSASAGVLFEGSIQFAFDHTGRKGEQGATGSVDFAAVICAGAVPENIRTALEAGELTSEGEAGTTPTPEPTQGSTIPDGDGDGVPDSDDRCPGQQGTGASGGCPDGDGDGVRDTDDQCPNESGSRAASGCPDGDGDTIRDSSDACPTEAGAASAGGCPDGDGDGIRNSQDQCPTQAGVASAGGCPDQDGDGVRDSQDQCVSQAGPANTSGCPDQDGDGIRDTQDQCPTQAGQASAGGCPDSDGDGIRNSQDACPNEAGQASAGGCPDSDGDGVRNSQDACPNQAGPAALGGCPDSDGDGVRDINDACPNQGSQGYGVGANGCPLPPPDSDGDGVPDASDACPNQGSQGYGVGANGCPLPPPDSDGDGVPDPSDACPSQGSQGYGVGANGCPLPPPDSDGDGVPDPSDACPGQGDQGYGLQPNGCPNPPPPPPDSDGDGVPDPSDACPGQGDQGYGLQPNGCPNPPPPAPPPPDSGGAEGVLGGLLNLLGL
jgi:nitrous oxidase accessory protein NosD